MTIAAAQHLNRAGPGRLGVTRRGDPAARLESAFEDERALEVQQDVVLQTQRAQYDFMTQERAELAREFNDTRAFIVEQTKLDAELLKKYIDMI